MNQTPVQIDIVRSALVDPVKRGECILFLGAALHAPPPDGSPFTYPADQRPPLGGELAQKLADACRYKERFPNHSCWDLQRVALCAEKTLGRKVLVDLLQKFLMEGKKPSAAVKMLAAMPFRIVVTTNYDRLLEQALIQQGKDPDIFVYDPDENRPTRDSTDDPTEKRPRLFKMHGDLQKKESIVITDEDYITFVQRMSDKDAMHPVPETIRYYMKKWRTLFVGYSLLDYNLRLLFRTLRWRVDPAVFPPSFSVDVRPDELIVDVYQHERKFISFVPENLWAFVPWLYTEVFAKEFSDG
jgi:SIR2-like domain